jgi:glycosyltransferase involved in cell wall biosynthesis
MRVLHVIPSLAMAHGGPSGALRLMARALVAQQVAVTVVSTDDDGTRSGKPIAPNECAMDGVTTQCFPRTTHPYKVSFALARWLLRHARDYDLIHIHALFSFSSTVAAWAARRAGVPYVLRPLGTLAPYGMTRRRPWLKRLSLACVEGPMLRHAVAVHCTSAMEREEAEALGLPMRCVVIPLAVAPLADADVAALHAAFPVLREARYGLFLSRLDPKKNVEGLLQAIALLAHDLPELNLLIAGDGEAAYVATLQALAKTLGIADRVVWAGHLQGAIKAAAFARAEMFVLPSYSENFGIAAAEALHCGLPVVLGAGVAVAAQVEAAGAGFAVAPDPEAIARAISGYFTDSSLRQDASHRAQRFAAREFSVATMGSRLVSLYRSIIPSPSALEDS